MPSSYGRSWCRRSRWSSASEIGGFRVSSAVLVALFSRGMRQKTLEFARYLGRLRRETWIRRGDSLGRRKYLPWLACAVLATIAVPAIAHGAGDDPATAAIVVTDGGFRDASGSDPADNSVTIVPGGK